MSKAVKGPDSEREARLILMIDRYEAQLLRLCCMMLHDASLAQDAVQETFVKAYRGMEGFRGESGELTWLTRIAINVCRDMLRSPWFRFVDRRVTPEQLPRPASGPTQEQVELAIEIMRLPRKYREVVLLYYDQDMTMEEIAVMLGVPRRTVSDRLKRARELLRGQLGEEARHG